MHLHGDVADREAGASTSGDRLRAGTPRRARPRSAGRRCRSACRCRRARPRRAGRRRSRGTTASPSLCPARPGSPGQYRPREPERRASSKACTSMPMPIADAAARRPQHDSRPGGGPHGVVILNASASPRDDRDGVARRPRTSGASSVYSPVAPRRRRATSAARGKPCGVCTAQRARTGRRSRRTRPSASTRLIVSATGERRDDAGPPSRTAATTRVEQAAGVSARPRRARARCRRVAEQRRARRRRSAGGSLRRRRRRSTSAATAAARAAIADAASSTSSAGATTTTWAVALHAEDRASARSRIGAPAERRRTPSARSRAEPGAAARGDDDDGDSVRTSSCGRASPARIERRATLRRARSVARGRALRRRAPRRGRSRPSPRRSSRRARARRSGSGAPWPACASRRPRGRGPGRGATGRARPRTP